MYERIKIVDKYILEKKEKEVIIADATSAAFDIPLDRYYKDYDMFLIGNIGKKGENGIIEDLKSKRNCLILVVNDRYSKNWQLPVNAVNYVKENFKKIDEIDIFDVYEK